MGRLVLFLCGSVIAWATLGYGLLSRFTPSKGYPEALDILLFLGGPFMLLTIITWFEKSWLIKIAGILQIAIILWIGKWLLADVLHYPWFN